MNYLKPREVRKDLGAQEEPKGIKYLEDPAKFLLDSGLLFRINRDILHPFGLALEVRMNLEGKWELGGIWDYRDSPAGMLFDDTALIEGEEKYQKFLRQFGQKKLSQREEMFGYIQQPLINQLEKDGEYVRKVKEISTLSKKKD